MHIRKIVLLSSIVMLISGCYNSNVVMSDTEHQKEQSVVTNAPEHLSTLPNSAHDRENNSAKEQENCSPNSVFGYEKSHALQNQLGAVITSTCPIK